jgi:haloacetate dehalogenase
MFDGFHSFDLSSDGVTIHGVTGGSGPPLLLLHGNPQTHAMWHKVAPDLAERFTVVACDLRGYGRSSKPPSVPDHASYSKRVMASDMVSVMKALGHTRFNVAGHDRGARVAHRLGLDWPDSVDRMALLDIAPTREMYANATDAFARDYWHWYFMIQPAPMPERMMAADPDGFWMWKCARPPKRADIFSPLALEDYLTAFRNPETIRATCEDYRAAATIDIQHDDEDAGRKLECPLLVLWGANGAIERHFDCLGLWRKRASNVNGHSLPGGHYLAEELPDTVTQQFIAFFAD